MPGPIGLLVPMEEETAHGWPPGPDSFHSRP